MPKKSPNKLMDINVLFWKLYKIKSPNFLMELLFFRNCPIIVLKIIINPIDLMAFVNP